MPCSSSAAIVPKNPEAITAEGSRLPSDKAIPSSEDWECHRHLIKSMYVDEGKKLSEVIRIMASRHGHNATGRMYKDRIKKWKLEKKNKESDMLAILRKSTERKAGGKQTLFRVRGRPVTIEQVHHYFKRKKSVRTQAGSNASTPSDVSYRTPSPTLTISSQNDNDGGLIPSQLYSFNQSTPIESTGSFSSIEEAEGIGNHCTQWNAKSPIKNNHVFELKLRDMHSLLSLGQSIPRALSPRTPKTFLISERLLFAIKTYLKHYFDRGTWIIDENGRCTGANAVDIIPSSAPIDFRIYCYAANKLVDHGSHAEFRRTLSKALDLVPELLRTEHPRTLDRFLDVFFLFRQSGRPEIFEMLQKFICDVSRNMCARAHPLVQVFEIMGMLEQETLEETMIQAWKCCLDSAENALGPLHQSTLDSNLDFIYRIHNTSNVMGAESLLRALFARCEGASSFPTPQSMSVLTSLGWNLIDQSRYSEAEDLGLGALTRVEDQEWNRDKIEALILVAQSQCCQGKRSSARMNMRHAIEKIIEKWGKVDPWAINMMIRLQRWLQGWGYDMEADLLNLDIDAAIGKDDFD